MKKFFLLALLGLAVIFANAQSQQSTHNGNQGENVKVVINVEDLNQAIKSYVEKDYPGYTIEKGMSLNTDGLPTLYRVSIKKGDEVRIVSFDKDFKFLSVIDPKTEKRTKVPSGNKN
jgi:outer membrane lipoprotein-sorting protein